MTDSLNQLEARHRLEGLLERVGLDASVDGTTLRCSDADAPTFDLTAPIDESEDQLLAWLEDELRRNPERFLEMPQRGVQIPADGAFPESAAWLERFYGTDFLPREKKPLVIDTGRSQGPFLRSIDAEPLQFLDSASQIASLTAGVRPGPVQAALDDGRFDAYLTSSPHAETSEAATAMARELLQHAGPGLRYTAWCNGGSEAVEKALHLARRFGGGGRRVIAFEGSFHGRTLLSLFSTWNPVKREPYQLAGFETAFVDFPVAPVNHDPACPTGWHAAWANKDGSRDFVDAGDPTLAAELASLAAIEAQLAEGDALAVLVEPYQCEGGDRGATSRFFNGLRALTRAYGTPLIFDEVQAGFGLSGTFFWHRHFWLTDQNGQPDGPDLVVCAKRAQVGLVLSRWPDAYPTESHAASLLRGSIHAAMYAPTEGLTTHVLERLAGMAATLPEGLVTNVRATGDAFGFDFPNGAIANAVIAQRFYRGMMVYIAGAQTLRYRMNRAMTRDDITTLVTAIGEAIEAVIEWAGGRGEGLFERMAAVDVPGWVAPTGDGLKPRTEPAAVGIRRVRRGDIDDLLPAIEALEAATYEPARQDPIAYLRTVAEMDGGIFLVAEDDEGLVGMAFGGPLELWWGLDGPRQDPNLHRNNTLYSADLSIAERGRGRGVGLALRRAFIREAVAMTTDDGHPRYAFITGRNRVGDADAMWRLNERFGAYEVAVYHGQYGDADARARYYRLPLRRWDRRHVVHPSQPRRVTDLGCGVREPTGPAHPELRRALALGALDEPALTKLTVSNFITRPYARHAELMRAIAPRGTAHCYFTSSLDELVDKSIRVLKHKRTAAQLPVGFTGGYFGHTTAGARSLVDWAAFHGTDGPGWQRPDEGFFGWPIVPHPNADPAATVRALDALVDTHGAEHLVGLYIEACQTLTGEALSDAAWSALCEFRDRTGVPIVLSETSTGLFRSGRGAWWSDGASAPADAVLWWAGGQLGHLFASDAVFVSKPLAFISTWDGDELSAVRLDHQFHAARRTDIAARITQLTDGLARAGYDAPGVGLYRVLHLGAERAAQLRQRLENSGLALAELRGGRLGIVPPVTVSARDIDRLLQVLSESRRERR